MVSPLLDVGGIVSGVVGGLLLTLLLLAVVIFVVGISNRADADPRGSRPMAAYYFAAAFLFLWIAFGGVVEALDSLINLLGGHPGSVSFYAAPSYRNAAIRGCVDGAILVLIVGGAFLLHLQRGIVLAETEADASGPTKRVMRSYVALVSLVSILVFVVAFAVVLVDVFRLLSPTIFEGNASRTVTMRALLDALVLAVLAGIVFEVHQRYAPDSLRLLGTTGAGRHVDHAEAPTTAPPTA